MITQLKQYKTLEKEIKDLESRIKKLKKNSYTKDVVTGSCSAPSFAKHTITISGYADNKSVVKLTELMMKNKEELISMRFDIEKQIQNIKDSLIRQIIRYKYIDELTWQDIAQKIGGNNTADSVRKTLNRYLANQNINLSVLSVFK